MTLYIGTSGWAYKEWKPDFYPPDVAQSRWLDHYVQRLTACEINATFYRLQSETTFQRWAAAAPDGFRYAVKVHRRITHSRSMAPNEDARRFIGDFWSSLAPLRGRLGALLFQYPPTRKRDDDALQAVLHALPEGIPFAFEFRHESWDHPGVARVLADAGGTVCVADAAGDAPATLPPGPLAYARLRTERYTSEQRAQWFDLLERESRGRDVFTFTKHEGIPTRDEYGGVGLAQWLREKIKT